MVFGVKVIVCSYCSVSAIWTEFSPICWFCTEIHLNRSFLLTRSRLNMSVCFCTTMYSWEHHGTWVYWALHSMPCVAACSWENVASFRTHAEYRAVLSAPPCFCCCCCLCCIHITHVFWSWILLSTIYLCICISMQMYVWHPFRLRHSNKIISHPNQ